MLDENGHTEVRYETGCHGKQNPTGFSGPAMPPAETFSSGLYACVCTTEHPTVNAPCANRPSGGVDNRTAGARCWFRHVAAGTRRATARCRAPARICALNSWLRKDVLGLPALLDFFCDELTVPNAT